MQNDESGFKMYKQIKVLALSALCSLLIVALGISAAAPDSISVFAGDDRAEAVEMRLALPVTATVSGSTATLKLLGVLPVKSLALKVVEAESLYVGGMAFGIKYFTKGVVVVGLCDVEGFGANICPAVESGIKKGDVILSVNGEDIEDADEFKAHIAESGGKALALTVQRGDKSFTTALYPALSAEDNSYKAGLWVRDSTAGIGTITYISTKDNSFAGLGHGICDGDTGTLMPLGNGAVVDVEITGVRKGAAGYPGEIKGNLDIIKRGTITANTETGVYGTLSALPEELGEPVAVGLSHQLKEGKAYIYSSADGERRQYEIAIEEIYKNSGNTRNFLIRVTDKKLLALTGGIVQGMSVCYNKTNTKKTA